MSHRGVKTGFGAFIIVARSSLPLISVSNQPNLTFFFTSILQIKRNLMLHILLLYFKINYCIYFKKGLKYLQNSVVKLQVVHRRHLLSQIG